MIAVDGFVLGRWGVPPTTAYRRLWLAAGQEGPRQAAAIFGHDDDSVSVVVHAPDGEVLFEQRGICGPRAIETAEKLADLALARRAVPVASIWRDPESNVLYVVNGYVFKRREEPRGWTIGICYRPAENAQLPVPWCRDWNEFTERFVEG